MYHKRLDLVHHSLLTVIVSILLRVQLVHETGLLVSGTILVATRNRSSAVSATSLSALSLDDVRAGRVVVSVHAAVVTTSGVMTASGMSSLGAAVVVNALGAALELARALAVALQHTALPLELVDAHGRQGGGAVVLGGVVVRFVHRDGGVDYFRLDHFLLDDRLDGFVDMTGEDSC